MLRVVTFKWRQKGYRSKYGPEQVNILRNMVARNYDKPFEFVCVTDDAEGIDKDIRVVPLWDDYSKMKNPSFRNGPSCYRRLKMFSKEAADFIGPRFVTLDLDCCIVRNVTPLWDTPEDFKIWGDTAPRIWYNGSMHIQTAGCRSKVWETFDPQISPKLADAAGQRGSDQGWIGYCLGPNEKTWSTGDGVYSYRNHIQKAGGHLPNNARIVIFHGMHDPWHVDIQRKHKWVKEHYR